MEIYLIRNTVDDSIVEVCDDEDNANQLKDNLVLTGEYKNMYVDKYPVNSDKILPLEAVKISGDYKKGKLVIHAYNPVTPVTDKLEFNVDATTGSITFSGFVTLTSAEQTSFDLDAFRERVKTWVSDEFKLRLENDN